MKLKPWNCFCGPLEMELSLLWKRNTENRSPVLCLPTVKRRHINYIYWVHMFKSWYFGGFFSGSCLKFMFFRKTNWTVFKKPSWLCNLLWVISISTEIGMNCHTTHEHYSISSNNRVMEIFRYSTYTLSNGTCGILLVVKNKMHFLDVSK